MKAFRMIDGKMHTAEAPDGALCLTLRSTFDPSGVDQEPIVWISRQKGLFCRRGGQPQPIPERTFHVRDLVWTPKDPDPAEPAS